MGKKDGIQGIAIGRRDLLRISPRELSVREGWNCRDVDFSADDPDDRALAESIAEVGVKQPLTAVWENGRAYITDGHRRLGATNWAIENLGAEILTVPVQTEDRYASEADMVLSQIVRNNGKPLSPIEMSRVYKRLIDLGWTERGIAQKSGRSEQWIRNLLTLSAAPSAVTEMVRSGKVSATTAIAELNRAKGNGASAAASLGAAVERAVSEGRTRATGRHIDRPMPKIKQIKEMIEDLDANSRIARGPERVVLDLSNDEFGRFIELIGGKL